MKKLKLLKLSVGILFVFISSIVIFPQKRAATKIAANPKTIVFAIINDGEYIEPVGEINKGKLVQTSTGDGDEKTLLNFSQNFYKPKTVYDLIFGGAKNGSVTIVESNPKSDCGKNLASVTAKSEKTKLKGFVMALATNNENAKAASVLRRLPTTDERAEIESLVRAEFKKQGVAANAVKKLNYYNLTALDTDNDGKSEMVGSFWVESSAKERNLLFFIAEKGANDRYKFGYSKYNKVTPGDLMSGELKDLDELGGESLLDILDYDGDSNAEIFTIEKAFEGNNFYVYHRQAGKWTRVYENYNYHCAF